MNKKTIPKLIRWGLELQQYDMKVIHRSNTQMRHVDALSRVCYIQDRMLINSLKRNQNNDERIKVIKNIITQNGNYRNYFIKNELLYCKVDNDDLIVIPDAMQHEIIKKAHDIGHFRTQKMSDLIRREFYIPKLKEKCEEYVRNCIQCILADRKQTRKEGLLNPIPKGDSPLHTFHIDQLGPLASTKKNFRHVLSIIDSVNFYGYSRLKQQLLMKQLKN